MQIPATLTIGRKKENAGNNTTTPWGNYTARPALPKTNQKGKRSARNSKNSRREESKQANQQKKLEYDTERKTMITVENGLRALKIASLNPDSMREATTQQEIVKGLAGNRIHIAEIQETHITQERSFLQDYCRIITEAADKNEATGVVGGWTSIMIRASAHHHIAQITRHIIRVLRVTLDQDKSKMPLHVISTYAPHNGHTEEERQRRWGDVKIIRNKTCKRRLLIW